jgi:hypothetical protein
MEKNIFEKIVLLLALGIGSCFGLERTVLSFDFDQQIPPIKTSLTIIDKTATACVNDSVCLRRI